MIAGVREEGGGAIGSIRRGEIEVGGPAANWIN